MARTTDLQLPDLAGRRALVTGGSDGMGVTIVERLAASGAEVLVPVRNRAKGESVAADVRARHAGARVRVLDLDLASLASVETLGRTLLDEGELLHLLVNNAGVMTPPERRTTEDGHELQLGVNHLGHVALVGHLLPLLREGRGRVTSQTSVAARRGTIRWDDPDWERDYDGMAAYRQSKIALARFALELARRSEAEGWGVTSTLAHPGVAPTRLLAARPELGRSSDTGAVRVIRWLSARGILVGTPESAALPALVAATSPDVGNGAFVGPQGLGGLGGAPGPEKPWPAFRDPAEARRTWDLTERLTGVRVG